MSVRKRATSKKARRKTKATKRSRPTQKPAAKKKKKPAGRSKIKPRAKAKKKVALQKKKPSAANAKKSKAALKKQRVAEQKARAREKKQRDQDRKKLAAEKARAKKLARAERVKKAKDAAREKKELARERAQREKAKAAERTRAAKEREVRRVAAEKAKIAERERVRKEREAERARKIAERDAARDAARRVKEEERARKEAEREAYRKAKEAERERLRAEREAARRALEGRVARASKRAQRADGAGRGGSTRVYRPDAIPNQSGTTRRDEAPHRIKLLGVRVDTLNDGPLRAPTPPPAAAPLPPPPPQPTLGVEERWARITARLNTLDDQFRHEYRESFEMSWVYHDSALEGVVYTFQELKTAIDPNVSVVADSGLQPVCDEIRRHRQAIEFVRELSEKKRVPINVDTIKKIYCILHPEEGDVKTVKYRKDIPQHRLYFHEYAAPDKIAYKVRQVMDWLNGPEPKKLKSPVRIAARVHYDLLRVFPFPQDSGKVSRLLMNLLLMRAGHPPAIVHSTERQRYYEALKGQLPVIVSMVNESITNALLSIEKRIEDYDATKPRGAAGSKPIEGLSALAAEPEPYLDSMSDSDLDMSSEDEPVESEDGGADADAIDE
ncbi:MAG TPA: Fic family protein [Polyangiaceae bacterium]|jgi:hypothetical protein